MVLAEVLVTVNRFKAIFDSAQVFSAQVYLDFLVFKHVDWIHFTFSAQLRGAARRLNRLLGVQFWSVTKTAHTANQLIPTLLSIYNLNAYV
jgi:hypothetical protein